MPHEIANSIASENPSDWTIINHLSADYGVRYSELIRSQNGHKSLINAGFGDLQTMIDLSAADLATDLIKPNHAREYKSEFEKRYDQVRQDPVEKFIYDNVYVKEFLGLLGPVNPLRRADGLDSSFELARIRRLLQNDFEALPQNMQRPEFRRVEALITEELALLWSPAALSAVGEAPEEVKPFIANTDDPNSIDQAQKNMPPSDRWKFIGAKLSAESASLFREIANSSTITKNEQLEATCRATDMEIRQLTILLGMSANKYHKKHLSAQIKQIADATMQTMVDAWLDPEIRRGVKAGKLFEFIVVSNERSKLMRAGVQRELVRLALPREDEVHERIGMPSNGLHKINLSADVIVEDVITGKFVTAYNAKSMSQEKQEIAAARKVDGGRRQAVNDVGRVVNRYLTAEEFPILAESIY